MPRRPSITRDEYKYIYIYLYIFNSGAVIVPPNDDFDESVNKLAIKSEQFTNCYLT